jgi:hypothetical protein
VQILIIRRNLPQFHGGNSYGNAEKKKVSEPYPDP